MDTNSYQDRKYLSIVSDILDHEEFNKIRDVVHHGMNRYDHCVRVSYYSYKIAKFLHLNKEETARGALLHDFFLEDNEESNKKERLETLMSHPKKALDNALQHFDLTALEQDIIVTHMFPVAPTRVPKYLESWLVDLVDDVVSVFEKGFVVRRQLSAAASFLLFVLVNTVR